MSGTGATEAQIERAAMRMHAIRKEPRKLPHGEWPCAKCHGEADAWAPCLVPEGHVIARAADVLTPEVKADMATVAKAVKRLHWDGADVSREEWNACYSVLKAAEGTAAADLAHLRAAATGGAE